MTTLESSFCNFELQQSWRLVLLSLQRLAIQLNTKAYFQMFLTLKPNRLMFYI